MKTTDLLAEAWFHKVGSIEKQFNDFQRAKPFVYPSTFKFLQAEYRESYTWFEFWRG